MYKKIFIAILIILLLAINFYLYKKTEKLDYVIKIGTHTSSDQIDFNKPLSDKEEANLLIFSLIDGVSIEKPKVCEELPDSTIWFDDWNKGFTYYIVNLWIDDNTVIIETDVNSTQPKYKVVDGNRAEDLKKLIERY